MAGPGVVFAEVIGFLTPVETEQVLRGTYVLVVGMAQIRPFQVPPLQSPPGTTKCCVSSLPPFTAQPEMYRRSDEEGDSETVATATFHAHYCHLFLI